MYEGTYDKANKDVLTPNYLVQTLLREFRTYDLIYRMFFYLIRNIDMLAKVQALKTKAAQENSATLTVDTTKSIHPSIDDITTRNELKFSGILNYLQVLKEIILISHKKNDLNRAYCSQFIRVLIHCIMGAKNGLFSISLYQEKQEMREIVLSLCKKGLWENDLQALGQLNNYESTIFQCVQGQETFHTIYLRLIEHVASSKAPNLNNGIRDNFVKSFLKIPGIMEHIFPVLAEEGNKIVVKFSRKEHPDKNFTLPLEELDEEKSKGKEPERKNKIKMGTAYFISSLNLMAALVSFNNPARDLMIVKYYRYDILNKAVQQLNTSKSHQKIRFCIGKIISAVHRNFFSLPFDRFPNKLQILNMNTQMSAIYHDSGNFIKNSVNTSLSPSELTYMNQENVTDVVDALKTVVVKADGDLKEVQKFIRSNSSEFRFEQSMVVIEEIRKVLSATDDTPLDFLADSLAVVISLLNQVITQKEQNYFEFIKQSLDALTLIEEKLVTFAATDIVLSLQQQNLLGDATTGGNKKDSQIGGPNVAIEVAMQKATAIEESENDLNESLLSKDVLTGEMIPKGSLASDSKNIIGRFSKDWKTGQRLLTLLATRCNNNTTTESSFKQFSRSQIVDTLLRISLLGEDVLLSEVFRQLKRISSYENLLFLELDKLTIVSDVFSLKKVSDTVKMTFRLNEIAREVSFCKDSNITLDFNQIDKLMTEVLDSLYSLFFIIYDPSKHFRYPTNQNAEQRFKDAFRVTKTRQYDNCFKMNEDAINRPFQKTFNILKTSGVLLRTLAWILDNKTGFTEDQNKFTHAVRLITMTMVVFMNKNVENQNLCSGTREFIRLFYNAKYLNQSADCRQMFSEMMRGNKKLLKLKLKYLYDTTVTTVARLSEKITNNVDTGYLTAVIMGFDYLASCNLSIYLFDPVESLRQKWTQMSNVKEFTKLDISTSKTEITVLPHYYYAIRELMEVTLKLLEHSADDSRLPNEIIGFLSFKTYLSFFESKNLLFQYELKNLLTHCISKIYFESTKKSKFTQNFDQSVAMISTLVCELITYRSYVTKRDEQNSTILKNLTQNPSFLTSQAQYQGVEALYSQNSGFSFDKMKLRIYMEAISISDLHYEYIYGGCLDLLFHILLTEVETCKQVVDKQPETKTIMHFVLLLLEDMIEFEATNDNFPLQKIEKFLNSASTTKGYEAYKSRMLELTGLFVNSPKLKTMKTSMAASFSEHQRILGDEATPLEIFNEHLITLKKNKRVIKEENIKGLADEIYANPKADQIIESIIKYLKRDLNKIKQNEIKFLLRLLRKYIERQNSNNPKDKPIYRWKNVKNIDARKINRIQTQYSKLGLTKVIYTFLGLSNSKITKEALLLSLAYTYGGNRAIQTEFFDQFIEDDENKIIKEFGNSLNACWTDFRANEDERMEHLTTGVQRNLFEFFKGTEPKTLNNLSIIDSRLEAGVDPKYLENADLDTKNQLFMLILTFFQSLCEGQYADMQNFLRNQEWKGVEYPNSFDLVGFLRHNINSYHKVLNRYNLSVGNKVLALITELIQGEVQDNIRVFLNKTFIYDMCRIVTDYNSRYHLLPRGFGLNKFEESFRKIKSQVIFVFKTMVENRSQGNIQLLTEHLDMIGLLKTFASLMRNFLDQKELYELLGDVNSFVLCLSNKDFRDTLGDAINIYIIFRYVYDDTEIFNERMRNLIAQLDEKDQNLLGILLFTTFKRLVTSIEIMVDSKAEPLMTIWFPILAVCNYLHTETQKTFFERVDRSSSQTKIIALVDVMQEIVPQIYTDYKIRKKTVGFNMANLHPYVRLLTNLISIIITLLNIGTYQLDYKGSPSQDNFYDTIESTLNVVQVFLAVFLVILWLAFFRTRHQSLMWERYVDENIKSIGFLPPNIKKKIDNCNFNDLTKQDCELIMNLKGANSDEFQEMKDYAPNYESIRRAYLKKNMFFTFHHSALNWHLMYTAITIGSLFHPIIAILQMFDIAIRSQTVKQVYAAVSKNAGQFLWTLFLLVVVNVLYSSIGFFFLNDVFTSGDAESDKYCTTAFSCFMTTINLGLRNGGGIGDVITPQPYDPDNVELFVWRIVFDMSFFIIMIILLLNLIFGMIIDSFGELRDQKTSNDEDQKNVCFICGIERSEFERHTNYEEHVANDHNPWAYVYYIVYLLDRYKNERVEMTDIENLVLEKYNQKNIGWIPIGKSLTLERIYAKEVMKKEDEMEKLTKKVDFLTQKELQKEDEIENLTTKIDFFTNKIDFLVQCATVSKKE